MRFCGIGLAIGIVLGGAGVAAAQQQQTSPSMEVRFAAGDSYDSVRVTLIAHEPGAYAHIPAGTMVSTADPSQQDLILGETVELEMWGDERTRTLTVPAFCLDSDRSPPTPGRAMQVVGVDRGPLARLAALRAHYDHSTVQRAVWDFRDGNRPSGLAAKLFEVAGVVVKSR